MLALLLSYAITGHKAAVISDFVATSATPTRECLRGKHRVRIGRYHLNSLFSFIQLSPSLKKPLYAHIQGLTAHQVRCLSVRMLSITVG